MADDNGGRRSAYNYRVMLPEPPTSAQFEGGDSTVRYRPVGDFQGRTPAAAVEAALEQGAIGEPKGTAVAVALSNLHEVDFAVEQKPVISVKARAKDGEADPPPPSDPGKTTS